MNLNYRRAALLSCHHAAWQSRANHPPVALPPRMRPLHRDIAADLFARSTSIEDKRARGNALAILQTAPRTRNESLLPPEQQAQLRAVRDQAQGDQTGRCPCCDLQAAHDELSGLPPRPTIVQHDPPNIQFDSDRMTTKVTTSVQAKVSSDQARRLLSNADPRNWKTAAPDFFTASDPGIYEDGKWTLKSWPSGAKSGLLRETVHWNWNGGDQVAVDNILNIEGLTIGETSIAYSYSLFTCLQSRLLVVWDSGGLDIDDGKYAAEYDPSSGILQIEASKRVRFTAPANGPFEIALALNLMAPATISMLMQQLVNVSSDDEAEPNTRGDQ